MDKDNLEAIAGRYLDSVYRVAINYCKNTENAADAVQNAFLKLMTTDTAFADDEHMHRWLLRVTINECKGFWRSFWHRNVVSLDALCEESGRQPIQREPDRDRREQMRELWEAVTKLPAKYSVVLHLHYKEGYSVDEIAETLGLSSQNVSVRLYRGRKKLKESLTKGEWRL